MLLTVTSTAPDATGLGFLLHKHPDKVQTFRQAFGVAHVFYPESTDERCTVALLLEVDPVGLVRGGKRFADAPALAQYVNDRPYAAGSMLAVTLGKVFSTALRGRCTARPELEGVRLPLEVRVPAVPARGGGADLVRRLFAPLGWQVEVTEGPLDPAVPRWGTSPYVDLVLTGEATLAEALGHLYVLLPVLDGSKHYWVGTDEVDKLLRHGAAWLQTHPERELVTRRYLAHRRTLVADALDRFAELDDAPAPDDGPEPEPAAAPRRESLAEVRARAVVAVLDEVGAHRVVDLGCGEGRLLRELVALPRFTEVVGVDVSARDLQRASRRLGLDRLPDSQRARLVLRQGSATYRDRALEGYDAVVLMEVLEHVDADRLPALAASVLGAARPATVVLTTPNVEHNVLYGLAEGELRHPDHRFEWTRDQLREWATEVADRYGYTVELRGIGPVDAVHGAPTQLAIFRRTEGAR